MNAHCTRLHLFMDGELSEADAEGFRITCHAVLL